MNVELPDGTTVEDVPDNISKAELATKLKANGMNVPDEWLATPKRKQGVLESMLSSFGGAGSTTADALQRTVGGAVAKAADTIQNMRTGRNDTFYQDALFKTVDEAAASRKQFFQGDEQAESTVPGQLASAVAGMPGTLVNSALGLGGIERATEVAKRGGSMGEAALAGGVKGAVDAALLAVPVTLARQRPGYLVAALRDKLLRV